MPGSRSEAPRRAPSSTLLLLIGKPTTALVQDRRTAVHGQGQAQNPVWLTPGCTEPLGTAPRCSACLRSRSAISQGYGLTTGRTWCTPAGPATPEAEAGVSQVQGQTEQHRPVSKRGWRMGEAVYLEKCSHKDPGSIPRTHSSCTCNPCTGDAETGRSLGLPDRPAW